MPDIQIRFKVGISRYPTWPSPTNASRVVRHGKRNAGANNRDFMSCHPSCSGNDWRNIIPAVFVSYFSQHRVTDCGYLPIQFQFNAFSSAMIPTIPIESGICQARATQLTVTDGIFDDAKYDADKSAAKFLLPVESSYIADWKVLAQKNGLGQISSMDEILANDNAQIRSMSLPIAILCAVLLLLTLLGIIGSQYQLMNHHRHIAFAFSLCGMDWNTWRYAWLFIAGVPLGIASVLGCVLGNLWWTTILLEPSSHWIAISFLLSLAIVTIALIGVTPTISRWSHMQVMQFRRGSE